MPKKYLQTAGGSSPGKPHLSPPSHCNACDAPIKEAFYDAATPTGMWAYFCPACFAAFQLSLGIGQGQHYLLQEVPNRPVPHPFSLGAVLLSKSQEPLA